MAQPADPEAHRSPSETRPSSSAADCADVVLQKDGKNAGVLEDSCEGLGEQPSTGCDTATDTLSHPEECHDNVAGSEAVVRCTDGSAGQVLLSSASCILQLLPGK